MINKKVLEELDKVDNIISSLNEIIQNLYIKAKDENLDNNTIAFLIYNAEQLENIQLELKDKNIEFLKDFVPHTLERSRLLCTIIAEKSYMEQKHDKMQQEAMQYFVNDQVENEKDCVRK